MAMYLIEQLLAHSTPLTLASDVMLIDHAQSQVYHGQGAVMAFYQAFFEDGFPEADVLIHNQLMNDQTIVFECTFSGCNTGPFLGIPATNREVTVPITLIGHLEQNQIQQLTLYYDAGTLLRQLGLAL